MNNSAKYTLAGCLAIIIWSCTVGFVRNVAEQLGPIGGAALTYSLSSLMLIAFIGLPRLNTFTGKYLLIAGALFACYEIFLSLALGMANNRIQAVEMGVINYLWPSLVVLFALFSSNKVIDKRVFPAIALSFFGVAWTVSGEQGLSVTQLLANIATNPVCYVMAFAGAFIWASYCHITKQLANGQNAITWFFIATAITLWLYYGVSDEPSFVFTYSATIDLVLAAAAMASGYALWNIGLIAGNMMLLAIFSYFTPLFSTFLSAYILQIQLTLIFWQGVVIVTLASLLCWWFTRDKSVVSETKLPVSAE